MKKLVAIRKESKEYLAYFLEQRIMLNMNESGAKILDYFLNQRKDINEIAKLMSSEYNMDEDTAKQDATKFLQDIYSKLTTTNLNSSEDQMLSGPVGCEIEITTACNLRCKHCFQGEYPEKYMTFNKFKSIVDILEKNNVYEIHLVGGEIFKHKDIIKMLGYLNQKDMAVTIVTNALGINEEVMKVFREMHNRICVLVSIDGTKKLHDFIRGNGVFDKVIPKIKAMRKENIEVELLCTLNSINVDHVDEIVDLAKELGVPVNFNLFKPFGECQKFLTVPPEKFFKAVEKLLKMRTEEHYRIGVSDASISAYVLGLPPKNECTATMSGIVINTDCKLITCPYLLQAGYYKESDLPEFNEDFLNTWKNAKMYVDFRKNGQKGCQARSLIFSHDVKKGDPYDVKAYIEYKQAQA